MSCVLGLNGKYYRNSGTYAAPTWNEITNVKDLALNLSKAKSDVSRRASGGWRANVGTLKEAALEWGMVWDTADDDYLAMRGSYLNGTAIDVMCLDGPAGTAGSQGFRADVEVMDFKRGEELAEAMMLDVSAEPTWSSNAPQWVTVS